MVLAVLEVTQFKRGFLVHAIVGGVRSTVAVGTPRATALDTKAWLEGFLKEQMASDKDPQPEVQGLPHAVRSIE
jgi:hypothetical protein